MLRAVAWCTAYGYLALGLVCIGLDTAIHFNGPAIDGPFQLYNALHRIALGQHIGTNFEFFHGAGVPYLHYLPFKWLGGDFFASELSRQLVSTVLFGATFFIVFFAWTRSAASAGCLSIGAACLVIITRSDALFLPINSLLGVRSTMPLILGAVLVWPMSPRLRPFKAGIATGIGLLLGTEQGLAMIAALATTTVLCIAVGKNRRTMALNLAIMIGMAVATYAIVVIVLGGISGLRGAFNYNFRIIPQEQFWYFGGPPNRFFFEWAQLWEVPTMASRLAIIGVAVLGTLYRFWNERARLDEHTIAETYLAMYAVFSMVSIFGTLVAVYLQPGVRVAFVLALLAVHRFDPEQPGRLAALLRPYTLLVRWRDGLVVAMIGAGVMYMRGLSIETTLRAPRHMLAMHTGRLVEQELSLPWQRQLTVGRAVLATAPPVAGQTRLWSTYSTIIEADAGLVHPSFDYLIHALGPVNRRAYVASFTDTRPSLVQTVRPVYAIYEEWLEDNHWPFYRELLRNYRLTANSDWSFFWTRRETPFDDHPTVVAQGPLTAEQHGITLDVNAAPGQFTLLEVPSHGIMSRIRGDSFPSSAGSRATSSPSTTP